MQFDDLHPGILEYVHWANQWPLHYHCLNEMPMLDGLIFEYMLHTHEDAMGRTLEEAIRKGIGDRV